MPEVNAVEHSSRSHARLNASSSHRWMMCPPSVKLSEQFADKPSPYAEEGTFLHELCELKLHRYLGDMVPELIEEQYTEHRDNDFYSDEAESVTEKYGSPFCIEQSRPSGCPARSLVMGDGWIQRIRPEGLVQGLVIVGWGIEGDDFKAARASGDADRTSQ